MAGSRSATTRTTAPAWWSIFPRPESAFVKTFLEERAALSSFSVDSAVALDGPERQRGERRQAAERFAELALPTEALEDWRYSRIDALDLERYHPAAAASSDPDDLGDPFQTLIAAAGGPVTIINTCNGYIVDGIQCGDPAVKVAVADTPESIDPMEAADAFGVLNRAFAPAPLRLTVARGGHAAPVVVVHRVSSDDDIAVFPRLVVEVGENAEATVVELVVGGGGALVVPVTDLRVAAAGRLKYLHVQDLSATDWQIGLQVSRVERDANLAAAAVALGGDYARLRSASSLVGAGASSRLLAMYFASGTQMHDFRTLQRHDAIKTHSDLLFKGVVANTSRSVYSGLIRVEKGAGGSNAFQTNRNLVLHEGAHADSVPNLEIEDNDVRCSHASSVGPIDEDQRFYLESRGVPTSVADRLIALGFLGQVLEELPFSAIASRLRSLIVEKLDVAETVEVERQEGALR